MAVLLSTSFLTPAAAQTIEEAMQQAYETNPDLLAARAELRAVDETVSQAYSGYRPSVFLEGRSEGRAINQDGNDFQLFTNAVGVTLLQNLYEGGGTVAAIDSSVNQVGQQRAVLSSVEQGVMLDVVTAYTDVVRRQQRVDLAINNEQRLERQLQATVDRFEVGEVTRTDVAQAEARLADAVSQRVTDEGQLAVATAVYEQVVGTRPGNLSTREVTVIAPPSLVEAQARAEKNPALVAAEFSVQAALADVRVFQADLLPTLDIEASVFYANQPTRFIRQETEGRIGAILTIPLYQGGAEYSRVRQAKQIVQQRRREFDLARRDVRELVTTEWEDLITAQAALRAFEESVRANQIALEGVQTEAQVGARTVLDVLDAEQELFDAQTATVDARAVEVVALYSLIAAMGELTAEAMRLDVAFYDPNVHYEEVKTQAYGLDAGESTSIFEDIDFRREWSLQSDPTTN